MSFFDPYAPDLLREIGLGNFPGTWVVFCAVAIIFVILFAFWAAVYVVAPIPRPPFVSETYYETAAADGTITQPQPLPCWQDKWLARQAKENTAPPLERKDSDNSSLKEREDAASALKDKKTDVKMTEVEKAEVFVSLVVPAYNEQDRLGIMLEEAIEFLDQEYSIQETQSAGLRRRKNASANGAVSSSSTSESGWEVLIVSDGSTDKTVSVALDFAKRHPDGSIRVVTLKTNRGKGGAVTHGMRHVRGQYVIFADADGASRFKDLVKLVEAAEEAQDKQGRVVAVGSRAHLVGSEAVVQRSKLRNFLMHSFHLLLRLLTPPATSRIKDTQCGFKLFSRASLPYIVPNMHSEGWIFDVEMLMLAERARIPMVEVPIGWHEVQGSKLNVLWDSLGMALGLAILRLAWALGVYQAETGE